MKVKTVIEGLRDPKDNPCWKGYKPVGTKKKNGKTVPNCVPKESFQDTSEGIGSTIAGGIGQFIGNKIDPLHGEILRSHGELAGRKAEYIIRKYMHLLQKALKQQLDSKNTDIQELRMDGESDFGEPGEILEDVLTALEREVEWPLTEIMDHREVQQLLQPIRSAVNAELRIITREKNKSLSEADVMSKISAATAKDVTIDNPDGTKTVVPMATGMLSKDEQGNLVLNKAAAAQANQQAAAGGAQQQPIKPGQQVRVSAEPSEDVHRVSATGGPHGDEVTDVNTKSAITGDEDHDEITKLLVQRLRKLAGVDRMTDETAQDMGDGVSKKTNPDGSYEITDGSGTKTYDAQGKLVKTISPRFAGVQTSTDAAGKTSTSYQSGPLSVQQGTNGKTSAEYDLAGQKLKFGSNPKR